MLPVIQSTQEALLGPSPWADLRPQASGPGVSQPLPRPPRWRALAGRYGLLPPHGVAVGDARCDGRGRAGPSRPASGQPGRGTEVGESRAGLGAGRGPGHGAEGGARPGAEATLAGRAQAGWEGRGRWGVNASSLNMITRKHVLGPGGIDACTPRWFHCYGCHVFESYVLLYTVTTYIVYYV